MHEPLLARIRELERSVNRWRLACLALAIVVVSLIAIGGTFGLILMLLAPGVRELEMVRAQEDEARAQAEEARLQADRAREAERAARQNLERQGNGP